MQNNAALARLMLTLVLLQSTLCQPHNRNTSIVTTLPGLAVPAGDDGQCKDFDVDKLDGSDAKNYCTYQIAGGKTPKVGDICLAKPQDAHPTQYAFGAVDANCVRLGLEAYAEAKDGSLRKYLSEHPVPTIIGPNGVLYITDHHHLSRALLDAFLPYDIPMIHRLLFLCIQADFSNMGDAEFWKSMQEKNLVWLFDERGAPIEVSRIPDSVKYLRDDPYRTLALYARQAYGIVKCGGNKVDKKFPQCKGVEARPYIEFRWANLFRIQFRLMDIYVQSDQAQVANFKTVFPEAVLYFSVDPANKDMEGYNQLGMSSTDKTVSPDDHGCVKDTFLVTDDHEAVNRTVLRTEAGDFVLTREQEEFVTRRQANRMPRADEVALERVMRKHRLLQTSIVD